MNIKKKKLKKCNNVTNKNKKSFITCYTINNSKK